jgi:Tol biopolymer transport system component/DNA-binding winged helix-turn-helix (wHTH) protein
MSLETKHLYEFGPFRLDPVQRVLLYGNQRVALQPKAFETLLVLIERAETVVLKDELMKAVWPDSFVEESNLAQNIFVLRKTLGETVGENRYIVTVPGRGYRFTEKVRSVPQQDEIVVQSRSITRVVIDEETSPARTWRLGRIRFLVLIGVLAGASAVWAFFALKPLPKAVRSVQLTHIGRAEPYGPVVTDGSRLYFTERLGGGWGLAQVAEQGGEPELISTSVGGITLFDLDRSRSRLLVGSRGGRISDFIPLWSLSTGGGSGFRLGDTEGGDAAWSPDGREIAYSRAGDLYVARDDGELPHKVFSAAGRIRHLRWSPDGRRLGLSVQDPATSAFSLWETAADGRDPHSLDLGWANRPGSWGDGECCGDWTPDGRYFVFRARHDDVTSFWALREGDGWSELGRNRLVQLYTTPDLIGELRFNPDGKKIFYVDYQERRELVRYDPVGKLFVPFLGGIPARHVNFSRDGQWVAYRNDSDHSLWRSHPDGTEALRLTFSPMDATNPTWSPDGKKIVFEANGSLYIIPSEGGKPESLLPKDAGGGQPNWSADGRFIIFARWTMSDTQVRESSIYLLDLSSGHLQMIPGSESCEGPQWSPDGRYVAAANKKDQKLALFDFQRHEWLELADGTPYGWGIRWSADGTFVYYQHLYSEEQPIFRVRLSDHKIEQVTSSRQILRADALSYSMTGLTPDDSPLASLVRRNSDIYALELDLP